MELTDIIRSRRSVRSFKEKKVSQESLLRILEAARWAPSWKNSQCPRFVVIEDGKIKKEIAQLLIENRAYKGVLSAPLLIAVCAELGQSGYSENKPATDKGDWYMFDCGLAVQNVLLEAWSLGLGSVIIGSFDAPSVATIIDLPKGFAVVNLIAMGHPDETPVAPPRKPVDQIAFLNRYGGQPSS